MIFKYGILIFISILYDLPHIYSKLLRPRGVSLAKASLYDPAKSFTCFDGSNAMPFNRVNDDYCDCVDGSDEPGTAACSNGIFYCNNAGHIGKDISTSFVNDGVCDCCDTSDEYASSADCLDSCQVLGEASRIELKRLAEVQMQGYNIRQTMAEEGVRLKKEKQARLIELNLEKETTETEKSEKLLLKENAETPEKEALEKYKVLEEQLQATNAEEKKAFNDAEARDAFSDLDTDNDGILTMQEVQARDIFDTNKDGTVSEDEAKFFFQHTESMDLESFVTTGWVLMRPAYKYRRSMFTPPTTEQPQEEQTADEPSVAQPEEFDDPEIQIPEPAPEEEYNYENSFDENPNPEDSEDYEEDQESEDGDLEDDEEVKEEEEEEEEESTPKIEYDEETQTLIDIASAARGEYQSVDSHLKDITQEIKGLEDGLKKDFGSYEEFRILEEDCYEFTDREYTYKLCPFKSASQISKQGHGETNLGSWGRWTGPPENYYTVMKYLSGEQCWNGPQRSTEVRLLCDVESKIVSVSEPNRCEYLMYFHTPAACERVDNDQAIHQHTEL